MMLLSLLGALLLLLLILLRQFVGITIFNAHNRHSGL